MAIGLDGHSNVAANGGGTGPFMLNHTCGGVQRLLIGIFVGMRNAVGSWALSSFTYNGATLTQRAVNEQSGNSRNIRAEVWTLTNPPGGSSYQVSVTPNTAMTAYSLAVMSLTGVDQTTPVGGTGTDVGQKTSYSASIVSGIADAWLVGGAGVRNGNLTWSPGTGVTEVGEQSSGGSPTDDVAAFWGYRVCTAAGSYGFAASVGSANHGVLAAVEVRPAATAPAAWFGAEVVQAVGGVLMFQ